MYAAPRRGRTTAHEEEDDDDSSSPTVCLVDPSTSKPEEHVTNLVKISPTSMTPPGPASHAPGAIIRIKMKNFVTYTSAEFKCGPSLNMILGPNGTGKSSLVCAICLGLGWSPIQLGRAKEIGEFVRNGSREAEIEVELKGGTRQKGRNPVIKRIIKRDGNSSKWFLNGQTATHKDIKELMHSLGIQVDNLCQFLPQDKVADFAALSPVELLAQTQKAVGTEDMSKWHEELKKLGAEKRTFTNDKDHIAKTLSELQNRQNHQKAEVDRLQERGVLQFRLNSLEKFLPVLKYQEEKDKHDRALEQKRTAKAALIQLRTQVAPALREMTAKEQYVQSLETVLGQRKDVADRQKKHTDTILSNIDVEKQKIETLRKDIKSIYDSKTETNKSITRRKNQIAHLEGRKKNAPPSFDAAEFNAKRRIAESEQKEKRNERESLEATLREEARTHRVLKAKRDQTMQSIEALKTQAGKQAGRLKAISEDSHKAWKILKEATGFEHKIFGPPIMTCSIKRPELSQAIEGFMQRNDQIAFTVQSENDNQRLQKLLYGDHKLVDIAIRTVHRNLSDFKPPVDQNVLASYKFDCWLIEALEGPDKVLAMLCDSLKLHKTAVSLKDNYFDLEHMKKSPFESFVVADKLYQIVRRLEYGPDAISIRAGKVRGKNIWTEGSNENQEEEKLTRELNDIDQKLSSILDRMKPIRDKVAQLQKECSDLGEEITRIEKEKQNLQEAYSQWELIPTKIDEEKRHLQNSLDIQKDNEKSLLEKANAIEQSSLKRAQRAIDFAVGGRPELFPC
jgi:chromosome segregation ATPase